MGGWCLKFLAKSMMITALTWTPQCIANVLTSYKMSCLHLILTICNKARDTHTVIACIEHHHFILTADNMKIIHRPKLIDNILRCRTAGSTLHLNSIQSNHVKGHTVIHFSSIVCATLEIELLFQYESMMHCNNGYISHTASFPPHPCLPQ